MNKVLAKIYKKDDNTFVYVGKTFVIMIVVFFLSTFFVTAIPNSWVNKNAEKSIAILNNEGNTSFAYSSQKYDGFTDKIMISISQSHSKSSMNIIAADMNDSYKTNADPDNTTATPYTRFWHGYVVLLKPALIFFDIHMIRQIVIILFMVMMAVVAYQLARYISNFAAVAFIIAVGIFNPAVVMVNLEYFSTYAVMFAGSIGLLYLLNKKASDKSIISLFLVIGGCTIFFDFLTTPIITWGIPLLIYVTYVIKHNKPDFKKLVSSTLLFSLAWAIGYGMTWATKWIVASMILNRNVVQNAFETTAYYTSSGSDAVASKALNYTLDDMFRLNLEYAILFQPVFITAALFSFIVLTALIIRRKITNSSLGVIIILVALIIAPFVWMLFSKSHSYIHHWMVHRDFIISAFGILLLGGYMWSKLKIKIRLRK